MEINISGSMMKISSDLVSISLVYSVEYRDYQVYQTSAAKTIHDLLLAGF